MKERFFTKSTDNGKNGCNPAKVAKENDITKNVGGFVYPDCSCNDIYVSVYPYLSTN